MQAGFSKLHDRRKCLHHFASTHALTFSSLRRKPKPKGYEVCWQIRVSVDHDGGNYTNFFLQTGGIEDEILLDDLKDDSPPDKIVLDIQDTSRYFESQSNAAKTDQMNIQVSRHRRKKMKTVSHLYIIGSEAIGVWF
jgi:hypothetical protein